MTSWVAAVPRWLLLGQPLSQLDLLLYTTQRYQRVGETWGLAWESPYAASCIRPLSWER